MATRIEQINERRARRLEQQQPTSPGQLAGSRMETAPERITYADSGIAPTVTSSREYRQGALQSMDEEQFRQAQEGMNASDKKYWSEQARLNPLNTYANLQNYFASEETPRERQKRERRERLGQVFSNLGNLIGNAAQLYYTAKGAVPADLNSAALAENERIRRIREKRDALKAKQDAILADAKANDIRNAYEIRLAREKDAAAAEDKQKGRDLDLAKWKMKLDADRKKGDADREERKRHNQALEANAARAQNKVVDSVIGSDGKIYTRNTPLSENEAMQMVMASAMNGESLEPYTTRRVVGKDKLTGDPIYNEVIDWRQAAADALQRGYIYPEELISRGFTLGGGMYPETDTTWSLSGNGNPNPSTAGGWSLNN